MEAKFWWEHLDALMSPVVVTDDQGCILFANETFLVQFGIGVRVIRRKEPLSSVLFFEDGRPFQVTQESDQGRFSSEVSLGFPGNDYSLVRYRVVRAEGDFGTSTGPVFLVCFHEVGLEWRLHKKHQQQLRRNEELISQLRRNVTEADALRQIGEIDTDRYAPEKILDLCREILIRELSLNAFAAVASDDPQDVLKVRTSSRVREIFPSLAQMVEIEPQRRVWVDGKAALLELRPDGNKKFWVILREGSGSPSNATFYQSLATRLEVAMRNHTLRKSSITDALTGVFNRGYFSQELESHIHVAKMSDENLALLIVDADHFKKVNDVHGHPVGDMALVMIADQLKKSCRTSDLIARLGGEEFGVILPCTSAKDSLFLAERIRKSIEASAIRLDNGETVRITVSIGVAELSDSIVTAEQLYKTADLALYDAKHGGRNTIRQAA